MDRKELDALRAEWLDRQVSVSPDAVTLKRFAGRTGVVREVNWNGRCLVDWQGVQDDGWYDIEPANLVITAERAGSDA